MTVEVQRWVVAIMDSEEPSEMFDLALTLRGSMTLQRCSLTVIEVTVCVLPESTLKQLTCLMKAVAVEKGLKMERVPT